MKRKGRVLSFQHYEALMTFLGTMALDFDQLQEAKLNLIFVVKGHQEILHLLSETINF